jgi:hypothetical protein
MDWEAPEYGLVGDLDDVRTEYVHEAERRLAKAWALVEAKGVAGATRELGVNERTVRRWLRDSS